MPEAVFHREVRQRQVIDDLLIRFALRWSGRQHRQTRRRRIAAKHRVRPINAGIDDRNVNALALITGRCG